MYNTVTTKFVKKCSLGFFLIVQHNDFIVSKVKNFIGLCIIFVQCVQYCDYKICLKVYFGIFLIGNK